MASTTDISHRYNFNSVLDAAADLVKEYADGQHGPESQQLTLSNLGGKKTKANIRKLAETILRANLNAIEEIALKRFQGESLPDEELKKIFQKHRN